MRDHRYILFFIFIYFEVSPSFALLTPPKTPEIHRVALCISGELRTYESRASVIQKRFKLHVIDALAAQGAEVSSFLVTDKKPTPSKYGISFSAVEVVGAKAHRDTVPMVAGNNSQCFKKRHFIEAAALKRQRCFQMIRKHEVQSPVKFSFDFVVALRPDLFWFFDFPLLESFSPRKVYANANHKIIGDVVLLIPRELVVTFYSALKQVDYPDCCFCERPICEKSSEATLLSVFAVLRIMEFDSYPFPSVLYRAAGAECMRWGPNVYWEFTLFSDRYPYDACVKAAAPSVILERGHEDYESVNRSGLDRSRSLDEFSKKECLATKPGLRSSVAREHLEYPEFKDFRNITRKWLLES
mmetsp:Transcript_21469/g.52866  ORF Transcript_21469/g.52866 Transcript_21469/m.52866 type:complete len:356 (-) Transcript_21469:1310-2377(-)